VAIPRLITWLLLLPILSAHTLVAVSALSHPLAGGKQFVYDDGRASATTATTAIETRTLRCRYVENEEKCGYDRLSGRRGSPTGGFSGKEWDAETGLDCFGARYMSSAQGRFTTPDPSGRSVLFSNPQTWNRYGYVYNRPLTLTDANGMWPSVGRGRKTIIKQAFGKTLSQRQIDRLIAANQHAISALARSLHGLRTGIRYRMGPDGLYDTIEHKRCMLHPTTSMI
jgi:RHS repeat-associated protein